MIILGIFLLFWVSSTGAQTPMEKFRVSDGAEIAYVDEGTPRLGTIIFVHGGPGYHSAYLRGFASSIKGDFRTILYDQRGSGLSSRTIKESSITIGRYVEDLHELIRDRKAVDVILLGQSFGGDVVLEYVLTHPEGVQGVVLENGMADARISMDDRVKGAFDLCQKISLPEVENVARKYQQGHELSLSEFDKLTGDELQEELYWYDADAEGLGVSEDWYRQWGYTDETVSEVEWICRRFWDQGLFTTYSVLDRLHQIKKPTLVVTGRHDQVISPRHAEEVDRRLPQSQLRILELSGHYPHIEEPQEFRRIIYEFVESQ